MKDLTDSLPEKPFFRALISEYVTDAIRRMQQSAVHKTPVPFIITALFTLYRGSALNRHDYT
jgi:hypothetical protein